MDRILVSRKTLTALNNLRASPVYRVFKGEKSNGQTENDQTQSWNVFPYCALSSLTDMKQLGKNVDQFGKICTQNNEINCASEVCTQPC